MRVSPVSIANQALYLLGAQRIDSLEDGSSNALICNQFYPQVKDEVLSSYEWTSAIYRTELAAVTEETLTSWEYKYRLPTDPYCYRVICVLDSEEYTELPYTEWYKEGKFLFTNESPCYVKYLGRVDDENDLDPWVVTCLIYGLSAKIATRILEDPGKAAAALQLYMVRRAEAIAMDGHGRRNRTEPPTPWEDIG